MLGMSWGEVLVIAIVALVVIGPEKMPEVIRGVAKVVRQGQRLVNEMRDSIRLDELESMSPPQVRPTAIFEEPNPPAPPQTEAPTAVAKTGETQSADSTTKAPQGS
ncbi:MAG: twin-arginine translocase TatA/TatE family subunit [Magnetococcales bacterium]|nr:twin-arginine translocase TatA/TatE family subunit [Magnetococcales bacterium]